ncbi:MAG: ABC transporter permease [Treponema sp.]|nr:ABC transporter permease [Treponema sp.]
MNAVRAIFIKQMNDLPRNVSITLLFILYPAMSYIMGQVMGDVVPFVAMFTAMFVGSTPMIAMCNTVAEDREYKSIRFLVIAGVKPLQYLFGLAIFAISMSLLPLSVFAYQSGYTGVTLFHFFLITVSGCIVSAILGASIGIMSKNVQQATAIYSPVMLLLALMPPIAAVNENIARIGEFIYSYQTFIFMFNPEAGINRPLLVIFANLAILLIFFVAVYKKKGLRG